METDIPASHVEEIPTMIDVPLALSGIRVLEVGSLIAGPFAGRVLADLGAEVIKIEAPDQLDPLREWGQGRYKGRSLFWPVQSRNKKLITLDMRKGRDVFLQLVERSDIIVENFRPGTMERWGLSYEELAEANPRIIFVRVSGFGQDGPHSSRAGFASVAEAASGLRSLNGYVGEAPPRFGISLGDTVAGLFAIIGALAAVVQRDRSSVGTGQVVDVSLVESCMALLESAIPEFDRLGIVRQPAGTRLNKIAPSNIFKSADDKWVVIAANQDNLFRSLCGAMGQPDLSDDRRFCNHEARGDHQEEIEAIIEDWARQYSAAEIDRILDAAGVPSGPVNSIADLLNDPHLVARGAFAVHNDPELGEIVGPGVVPRMSRSRGDVRWSGPWQEGTHNKEIYSGVLGMSDLELQNLRDLRIA